MSSTSRIYKYQKIDEYLFISIVNNELYFANPRDFNDLFDSKPLFKITSDKTRIRQLFEHIKLHISDRTDIDKSSTEFKELKKSWDFVIQTYMTAIKSFNMYDSATKSINERLIEIYCFYNYPEIFETTIEYENDELQMKMFDDLTFLLIDSKRYGISCSSKTSTCPLMWGHYAKNHTGICMEFEIQNDDVDNQFPMEKDTSFIITEVNYDNEPIDLYSSGLINEDILRKKMLSTKSDKWSYEKEVRLIFNQGPIKFKKQKLKKIIFGAKSSPKARYTICKLLACLGYNFEFMVAKIRPDQYELKIETMTLNDIAGSGVHIEELGLKEQYDKIINQ
ncbi:MAG: DUF2971 domain-containing protein [Vicingaceae bacterium]|nr:DUF2971 domain-containing protein [Vicingaceae bacterium]